MFNRTHFGIFLMLVILSTVMLFSLPVTETHPEWYKYWIIGFSAGYAVARLIQSFDKKRK